MNSTVKKIAKSNEFFMFAIILVMFCIFGLVNPAFFSTANLFDLARSMVETGILALGCQVVMISGGIDLSFMAIGVFAMHTVHKLGRSEMPVGGDAERKRAAFPFRDEHKSEKWKLWKNRFTKSAKLFTTFLKELHRSFWAIS